MKFSRCLYVLHFAGPTVPMRGEATPIYPSDEPGEEMSELSRVWRIYVDEAAKFDASLTEGCNRGIDVLLVFVSTSSFVNIPA